MSATTEQSRKIVPAQLGFFAIYNPSLGTTDETFADQIVYYSSEESRERSRTRKRSTDNAQRHALAREETNEQLRQIGLSQGMVEFGRTFSDGQSVDAVETEKSRVILHELESGWWIIASINLTIIPPITKPPPIKGKAAEEEKLEYSSREVKPAMLLLGDVLRAHSTFLLHHASSLSALFVRTKRPKFVSILGRYWDAFISTWSVLMYGNPANSLYGGIKLAACGELGMGVGEEERGSGEREVLEGLVGRIDGLVDVVVSKFGDTEKEEGTRRSHRSSKQESSAPWLGSGNEPAIEDGVIFLGTGALSRKSTRDLSHWMEDLYRWGQHAYGVLDNPTSNRRSKMKRGTKKKELSPEAKVKARQVYGLGLRDKQPHSQNLRGSEDSQHGENSGRSETAESAQRRPTVKRASSSFASKTSTDSEGQISSKFVQFMKLGYGTHWSLTGNTPQAVQDNQAVVQGTLNQSSIPQSSNELQGTSRLAVRRRSSSGQYLIGFMGDVEEAAHKETPEYGLGVSRRPSEDGDDNERVLLRTVTVELEREEDARAEAEISIDLGNASISSKSFKTTASEGTDASVASYESQDRNKTKKLRVVVYINRPFIFVFLFEVRTEVLAMASLYRSLHCQIGPLIKPLLNSTAFRASKPEIEQSEDSGTPIYDLIWDPKLLTVTSTIPNIPDPYQSQYISPEQLPWTRVEAINTHIQIINTYISTTTDRSELERTCKTSRGWWVVWTRIPDPEPVTSLASGQVKVPGIITEDSADEPSQTLSPRFGTSRGTSRGTSTFGTSMVSGPAHPFLETVNNTSAPKDKEIFLIRRASDHVAARSSRRFASGSSVAGSEGWTVGPGKLAQGIGVDTKRYIDALLNLGR